MTTKKPIVLAILDGFGLDDPNKSSNAVAKANMVNVENLKKEYPWVKAHASGKWVGLPDGQMGNSEVGHIHIGAGRILYQSLSLINNALKDQSFYKNAEINNAINFAKKNNGAFHIMGMLSDGGVHSHINHFIGALETAAKAKFDNVYLHIITDGRDTKPSVAKNYIKELQKAIAKFKIGKIASISGRYYAMDRDKRWERVEKAYDAIANRKGLEFSDPLTFIDDAYKNNQTDEFIVPGFNKTLSDDAKVKSGDGVLFINFRPDRAIQLASVMTNDKYLWVPKNPLKGIYFVSMMKYADSVSSDKCAFAPAKLTNVLGEVISNNGLHQLRLAETEKIAHVTYFMDGGKDIAFKNSTRLLIPSPKVATYDLKPEMSAPKITEGLVAALDKNIYDVVIMNYANPDMVGHTGVFDATVTALKALDECILKVYEAVKKHNGTLIITADHGNAEVMIDETGGPNKKHTSQQVPIIICDKSLKLRSKDAAIADIAPTILELLNIKKPAEMTQTSLIVKK